VVSLCEGTVEGLAFVEVSEFEVDVANDDISCAGEDNGSITATATNGVTPYNYSWENLTTGNPIPDNDNTISDLPAGLYSVTVNDNDGCADSTLVEILEPEALEATASVGALPNCYDNNGGSIDLSVSGGTPGFSYLWSSGDTTQDPVNLASGDYTVTVTDAFGCEATEQITVGEDLTPPDAVAAVFDTINCYQPTISLSGAGSSSGNPFEANWSGPGIVGNANTLAPTVNTEGTYILAVTNTDNGCVSEDTITVNADLAVPIAVAEDGLLNCYNPQINLNADGSSVGSEYNYQWDGPGILGSDTVIDPLVFSPGDYTLTVTDLNNGCEEAVTVTVLENKVAPVIDAGAGTELDCFLTEYTIPATASGNVGHFVYEWTTSGGNIISGADTLNPLVDVAGVYELLVTDTLNGCSSTDNVSIIQDPSLPVALVDGQDTLTCQVNSIALDATSSTVGTGGSFEWLTDDGNFASGQNTLSPSVDAPGTYYLIVTGGGSVCEDTAEVVIPIDTITPAIVPASAATLTCDVTAVQLSAQASIQNSQMEINWFGPAGLTIISPDSLTINAINPGSYTLVVNDLENGCTSSTTTIVDQDIETPAIDVAAPLDITCGNPQTIIDASGSSSGNNFNYQWAAPDGSILTETSSTLTNIDEPGLYSFTIENTTNGCVDNTTITVEENINYPILSIEPADLLTCVNTNFDLNASATSTSGGLLYLWSTADGTITAGGNTPTPNITEPGLYTLQVTDVSNDCVTTEAVTVNQDVELPVVDAGAGTVLTCIQPDYTLSGNVITSGAYDVIWSTTDGSIQNGANTLTPLITSAGTYILQAIDQSNGCSSTSEVAIVADDDLPVIDIAAIDMLDCSTTTIDIDATASDNGPEYVYNWTDANGNTLGNANILSTTTPGTFTLEVTNTDNGCTNTEETTVNQDITAPLAEAGPQDVINCYNPSLVLNAAASSQGSEFVYQWTTTDGLITADANTLSPTITQAGTYELLVTNTSNNCTATDIVSIQENLALPAIQIATPEILDCETTQTNLNSTGSSTGSVYNYQWTTNDGNILSGDNGTSPLVDDAGTYVLEIINTVNGCSETASILVEENVDLPVADAGLPQTLNCEQTSLNIDATASSQGDFSYQWTGPGIVSGSASLTPVVNTPGLYTIVVTNLTNSCTSQDAVIIGQDITPPEASIAAPLVLNCAVTEQALDATATSQGPDFEYNWTASNNGNILQGDQSLTPLIDQPGTYELVVLNTNNGCVSTESINVVQDIVIPEVANTTPEIINCNVPEITIDASASSTGSIYEYQWSSNNGNIIAGANTLTPLVDENGTYELLITNTVNECTNSLMVEVEKDVVAPVAEAGQSQILNCVDVSLTLDGDNSSTGGIYTYQWDGPGLVTGDNTLSPEVDEPGVYSILVTNTVNGCTSTDAVIIQQDIEEPVAVIASPQILNCQLEAQTLDASATNQGAIFEYQWTATATANIVSGANTLNPLIDEPGSYTLFVTNTQNGCTDEAAIVVSQDITIPEVAAEEPEIITCDVPAIVIDGSASSSGAVYTYAWATNDGNIVQGANTLMPEVDEGGLYELLITNTTNFCTNTLQVNVEKDVTAPLAEAGPSEILNCTVESLSLDGDGSSTGDFSYQWEGPGLLSGQTSLTPSINEPGLYFLVVTNNFNGCVSEDFVLIEQDIAQPTAQIEPSAILNCLLVEQQLDGTLTNQGSIYEYEWTTSGTGNIVEGANTLTPLIDQPGTYMLLVTNTENGCTDTDDVTVSQDIAIPIVDAEEPAIVTCAVPQIEIDATASSLGNNFEYLWTASNGGNITEGENTLTPTVDEGGLYQLLITNTTNYCTNVLEVEVEKDVEHPNAEAGPTQELNCDIGEITIDGNGSSLGDFSYQWEGPGLTDVNTLSILVDEPGTYQLTVTNNFNGCSSTDQVVITQDIAVPVPDILLPEVLTCATTVVTLDASNSSQASTIVYEWTTNNGNIVGQQDSLITAVNQPGQYTLNIYNQANECENSMTIDVAQDIEQPVANAGDDYLMDCWEPTDELNANGSSAGPEFAYQWTTENGRILSGENTLTPVIDAAGIYSLWVTDMDNGCVDDDDVLVSQTYPATSVQVGQPPCYGDPGHIFIPEVIGGTAPFVYSIDGGNDYFTGGNFTNLNPGNYNVVVQDVNGCEYETMVSIEQPDSMVVLLTVDETEIQFGETHQIITQVNIPEDEISQINWTNAESLSCDDCLLPVAQPFYTTDYRVNVVSIHGCEDRAFLRIFVDRQKSVYAPNIFSPNGDGANDRFYLFAKPGSVEKIKSFGIFNRWGEPVFEAFNFQPNDPTYGWDGFFRGELMNSAVFVWYAEIEFVDGTSEIFEGDVTLFR
jgi:gliding motility-associated-like protein